MQILGLTAEPLFTRIYRWKSGDGAIYRRPPGTVERIEKLLKQLPGLALAGNAYRGIGVPDCVRSGQEAAAEVVAVSSMMRSANSRYGRNAG